MAGRAMMEALARCGFAVHALSGTILGLDREVDPTSWLSERGWASRRSEGAALDDRGRALPPHLHLNVRGVPIVLHLGHTRPHEPDDAEREAFLRLFDDVLDRFRPDVVVGYGGNRLVREVFARAQARGAATAFLLQNLHNRDPATFADVDAV
ncbi:MAG: glycosyltransferase, partial [Singulisphaera sp.]